jgi:hypothetical protein
MAKIKTLHGILYLKQHREQGKNIEGYKKEKNQIT